MPVRRRVLIAAIVTLAASPAVAGDRNSEADQDACRPDVFRLCMSYIPNEAAILACLNARHLDLTPQCRRVIDPEPSPQRPRRTIAAAKRS